MSKKYVIYKNILFTVKFVCNTIKMLREKTFLQ